MEFWAMDTFSALLVRHLFFVPQNLSMESTDKTPASQVTAETCASGSYGRLANQLRVGQFINCYVVRATNMGSSAEEKGKEGIESSESLLENAEERARGRGEGQRHLPPLLGNYTDALLVEIEYSSTVSVVTGENPAFSKHRLRNRNCSIHFTTHPKSRDQ
jgi:hypothetical protein